jgi:hypothetical protein
MLVRAPRLIRLGLSLPDADGLDGVSAFALSGLTRPGSSYPGGTIRFGLSPGRSDIAIAHFAVITVSARLAKSPPFIDNQLSA